MFEGALSTSQFIAIIGAVVALGMLARLKMRQAPMEPDESPA
jgi:hypothetical protein